MVNDWDFSDVGRKRQSLRMKAYADYENEHNRNVICDFVCPTEMTRKLFDADFIIWMNTIDSGRFEDTNKIFENPSNVDITVTHFLTDIEIENLSNLINAKINEFTITIT
jgi:adenylylsulfate kinase